MLAAEAPFCPVHRNSFSASKFATRPPPLPPAPSNQSTGTQGGRGYSPARRPFMEAHRSLKRQRSSVLDCHYSLQRQRRNARGDFFRASSLALQASMSLASHFGIIPYACALVAWFRGLASSGLASNSEHTTTYRPMPCAIFDIFQLFFRKCVLQLGCAFFAGLRRRGCCAASLGQSRHASDGLAQSFNSLRRASNEHRAPPLADSGTRHGQLIKSATPPPRKGGQRFETY